MRLLLSPPARRHACLLAVSVLVAACAVDEATGPANTDGDADGGVQGDAGATEAGAGPNPVLGSKPDAGSSGQDASLSVQVGGGDGGCGAVTAKTEPGKGKVDVVWVIDDSLSMLPQVLPVGENMGRFMEGVRQGGGDISVVMVTGPIIGSYLSSITDPNYHWVPTPVQSWDAFSWAINAYGGYTQYLRPDAVLHMIFVSDDASNMAATDFLPAMERTANKPFTVHAVAADGLTGACLGAGNPLGGVEYYNAATTTGGEKLSLCGDWGTGFGKLQSSVTGSLPLPCEYTIPAPPSGETLNPNAVQVLFTATSTSSATEFARASDKSKCAENVAWHFDDEKAPKQVVMCPKACDAVRVGGAITLGFGCEPSVVLR
jgi:hypothetical protein